LHSHYEAYIKDGPGAEHVSLEDGLVKLGQSKEDCERFTREKVAMVLSETLFGLPISQFDELIKMENLNAQYSLIYEIFKNHQEKRAEWAVLTWGRLDIDEIEQGSQTFLKEVRKLEKNLKQAEKLPPFEKLKSTI